MARLVRPASMLALALAATGVLGGCDDSNHYVAPPPAKVTVALPEQRQITPYLETTGSTAAVNQTNLVARVAGYVEDIKYKDGSLVTKGTILFVIEPEPYRVRLEQAKAAKAGAEASLKQLEADYQRQSDLVSSKQDGAVVFRVAVHRRCVAPATQLVTGCRRRCRAGDGSS